MVVLALVCGSYIYRRLSIFKFSILLSDRMKDILANTIINASNLIQFAVNLILIKYLSHQEIAIYYYYLAIYLLLSLITGLYTSKAFRESVLNRTSHKIGGIFTMLVVLSFIINTTLLIVGIPLYLFVNFLLWHVIDYFNNFLIYSNHPNRVRSIILTRIVRLITVIFLAIIGRLDLEDFSLYSSILPMLTFYFVNRSLIRLEYPYIPRFDISNLGGFIGEISSTLIYNLDNLVMKSGKGFSDIVFSNINYVSVNMKYLSGTFHSITFPFLINDLKEYGKIRLGTKVLHLVLPMMLFTVSSVFLFLLFTFLNIYIIPTYPLVVIAYAMINLVVFLRTYLIALDYKKPLFIAESIGILILFATTFLLLDSQDPYQSYTNYLIWWSVLYLMTYIIVYLFFKVR